MSEMFYTCPKDPSHQSADSDYCSICGAKIAGAPAASSSLKTSALADSVPVTAPVSESAVCPDCGSPKRAGARFCEICRYNFDTQKSGSAVTPAAPLQVMAVSSSSGSVPIPENAEGKSTAVEAEGKLIQWEAIIHVDPSLYDEPDPSVPCPINEPERVFPIDLPDNLIGRRSPRKDIFPQIPLNDPGISHRHAKILRQADGTLLLLDVGSTNGTELNGKEVLAGVRSPLQNGDQITLGCWTRIIVQSRQVSK